MHNAKEDTAIYDCIKTIRDKTPQAALFEQLAEEHVEAANRCLKMARIIRGESPTPATRQETMLELLEEETDVDLCRYVLHLQAYDKKQFEYKAQRWSRRLQEV